MSSLARLVAAAHVCEGASSAPCCVCRQCKKVLAHSHPDVTTVEGDGEIVAAEARRVRADAWVKPNEARARVFVVERAENLNMHAQNALLNVLEDPPGSARFIFTTENPPALLPTVRSRCAIAVFAEGGPPDGGANYDLKLLDNYCAALAGENALALFESAHALERIERVQMEAFLEDLRRVLHASLLGRYGAEAQGAPSGFGTLGNLESTALVRMYDRVCELIDDCGRNAGVGHVAGALALF